jgi:UDP-glucose 4-epimerase
MRVLLTGASSFTGYWFARALAAAGHTVVAPLRGVAAAYAGVRGERVRRLAETASIAENCPFGSVPFCALLDGGAFDLLAHHAAATADYRSADFDIVAALGDNTRALAAVLRDFRQKGGSGVLLTGSVFEPDEGAGSAPMSAFSPYGLSKGLTAQVFRYWCGGLGLPLGKFVIANPFGPFEEPRFCDYMIRSWLAGATPVVRTPRYVRDNIPVDLLALLYARFAARVVAGPGFIKTSPSFYPESQGAFALRLARELGPRLGIPTPIEFAEQTEFPEPAVRINTDIPDTAALGWNESAAWDAIAAYYRHLPP